LIFSNKGILQGFECATLGSFELNGTLVRPESVSGSRQSTLAFSLEYAKCLISYHDALFKKFFSHIYIYIYILEKERKKEKKRERKST